MKKISEIVFGIVFCAIAAFGAVHIVTGCGLVNPEPGHRLVVTEQGNVQPEAFNLDPATGQPHAQPAPIEKLSGSVGNLIKERFAGKTAVLTTEDWLNKDLIPGSFELFLDANSFLNLTDPSTYQLVTAILGKVLPGSVAPWAPLITLLPLLTGNGRKNAANALQRVVPGVASPDPSEAGKIPAPTDLQKAIVDMARMVTFHAPDPNTVNGTQTQLNG